MTGQGERALVLGGGVAGLAIGLASGSPVFEAAGVPGGICASYYVRPGSRERLYAPPDDGEAYRFEIGGGHWIFGGDPAILQFVERLAPTHSYERISGVWFPEERLRVAYPLQNHLARLGPAFASRALEEIVNGRSGTCRTLEEWLHASFGRSLCERFFEPFHDLYTAGLHRKIAPQDDYKSPVDVARVIEGASPDASSPRATAAAGYNVRFRYPQQGLDRLVREMAAGCDLHCDKRVERIDVRARRVFFADGSSEAYDRLLSTLPLNRNLELCGFVSDSEPDPHTSVLVLNIGGVKGAACPADHWLYVPRSRCGFHRVGFYSNVESSFLPRSARRRADRVSIYVERAFAAGRRPGPEETLAYGQSVVRELADWGFLEQAEVVDPTWIDVAYTWRLPGSSWKARALSLLEENRVFPVGRYGRWNFQGIAESLAEGYAAGAALKAH